MKTANRLDTLEFSKIRLLSNKVFELQAQGREMHMFTLGQPDFLTPDYIKEACKQAIDDNFTTYPDYCGPLTFRQAVVDKYERENGLKFDPMQVISTCGAAQAAYLVLTSFLNPGDEVLVPNPMYNIYDNIANICGATPVKYTLKEENDFQIDLEEMAGLINEKTKMIVVCSPNNPIGGVLTQENLEGMAKLIEDKDILVCSDEIYERLTYDGFVPVSPASLPSLRERTIIINGFSKAFSMTGWRVGYVITPMEYREKLYLHTGFQVSGIPAFVLEAATVALNDEPKYGTVEKMRKEFEERRNYFVAEINKTEHFSCKTPKGAFYIFMNIKKTGMESGEFIDWLLENYGIAMVTGTVFGSEGEGYVRISYASSMEHIKAACELLHKADADLTAMGR
ncbi:MAG: pyridoxal phosphate-dependent aminotransferase [Firmicutes bacterium]|nr:pyridoxal phosphate-dependent aminotransferase [Bacillota bacterium]